MSFDESPENYEDDFDSCYLCGSDADAACTSCHVDICSECAEHDKLTGTYHCPECSEHRS